MKRIPRRTLTEEFKREAIKLVTEQGLKLSEVSKRLEVRKGVTHHFHTT